MMIAHDVTGTGPAVMLLHSTVCDRRMWDPQVPVLAEAGFRVVRCDFRGYGETPAPDRPASDAADVLAVLELLGADTFALVGASGGGAVALEIAATVPQRVTALALLCTAGGGLEPSADLQKLWASENALLAAGDVAGATEVNVETFVGPAADEQTRDLVRRMQRHAFDVQLAAEEVPPLRTEWDPAAVTARTLLVAGAHDLPDFGRTAVALAAVITGAERVDLDWAGHLPSLERPDRLNPLLLDFLARP